MQVERARGFSQVSPLIYGVIFAGMLLRALFLNNSLWFDELLSLDILNETANIWDIAGIKHDNNHHLNSFWLYLIPRSSQNFVFRLHSFIAGTLLIYLAGLWGQRRSQSAAFSCAVAASFTVLLVSRSCQARGYMLMLCFCVLAFLSYDWSRSAALEADSETELNSYCSYFRWSCIFGLLSHATFIHAFNTLILLQIVDLWQNWGDKNRSVQLKLALQRFLIPILFTGFFAYKAIFGMTVAGGPPFPLSRAITGSISVLFDWPALNSVAYSVVLCGAVIQLFLCGLSFDREVGRVLLVVLVCPLALIFALRPDIVYPRYFLPGTMVLLLTLASRVPEWVQSSRSLTRFSAQLLVCLWICAQLSGLSRMIGRDFNPYHDIINIVQNRAESKPPRILDMGIYLQYHKKFYSERGPIPVEFDTDFTPQNPPQFALRYAGGASRATLISIAGHQYRLVRAIRVAPHSGMSMAVYERR